MYGEWIKRSIAGLGPENLELEDLKKPYKTYLRIF
jgi:hypothetical protein